MSWIQMDISEMKSLLKDLKIYKNLRAQVWRRGRKIFAQKFFNQNEYRVEYFTQVDKNFALDEAQKMYKKVFWEDVSLEQIIPKKNPELKGGMRIFRNNDLIDLSYKKIETQLTK